MDGIRSPSSNTRLHAANSAVTNARAVVVVYFSRLGTPICTDERVTLAEVANAVARVKHCEFAGSYDESRDYSGPVYFVPDDTLMQDEAAS